MRHLTIWALIFGRAFCEDGNATVPQVSEEFKCLMPDVTSIDTELDVTRFRADFSKISEVKFPSLIGPLNEKLICKIKCIDGNWVGPLCSSTPDGRFQPVLRECFYHFDHPLLHVNFRNSSINEATSFPHGSKIQARCKHFGLYKLKGDGSMHCENGEWVPKFPECVPTSIVTNFTGDAPPTIIYTLISGSASVEPSGELYVYPESTLRLDCVSPRTLGDPEWSWTVALGQHNAEWSTDDAEKDSHYRLTLSKVSMRHSDQFTCTSPAQLTNTIVIKVVNVACPPLNESTSSQLIVFTEGSKLGQSVHFSCEPGFHLDGPPIVTCMGDGRWSSAAPSCVEISCPPSIVESLPPHLTVVEYNCSFGGRVVFQCSWGYRLQGAPGLECEQDGTWSGPAPQCAPVYCPSPLIPERGRLLREPTSRGQHSVGDLIMYSCDAGLTVVGEPSIVCTESGFWSHPPPFCVPLSEVRQADTVFIGNATLHETSEETN